MSEKELKELVVGGSGGGLVVGGDIIASVLAGLAPNSRKAYTNNVNSFVGWQQENGDRDFSRKVVLKYKDWLINQGYAPNTINQQLATLRQVAGEMGYQGWDVAEVMGIKGVKSVRGRGRRAGMWLSKDEVKAILKVGDVGSKGDRDRLVVGMLVGMGLRRGELVEVRWEDFRKGGTGVVLDVLGKGNKIRTIPVPSWVLSSVREWALSSGLRKGILIRSMDRHGNIGDRISREGIGAIVGKMGEAVSRDGLCAHDLRRTWARMVYNQGGDLKQISLILGHANIKTTELYIGINDVDLDNPLTLSIE